MKMEGKFTGNLYEEKGEQGKFYRKFIWRKKFVRNLYEGEILPGIYVREKLYQEFICGREILPGIYVREKFYQEFICRRKG